MRALITAALLLSTLASAWADPPTQGLRVWLRADAGVVDLNGQAAADGAIVSTWADQAGGRLYGRADSWAQPIYVADAINGRPAIRFDGGAARLYSQNLGGGIETSSITVLAVVTGHDATSAPNEEQVIFADGGWWGYALERATFETGALTLYSGWTSGDGPSVSAPGSLPLAGYGSVIVSGRKQFGVSAAVGIDGHTLATSSSGAVLGPYAPGWQPYSTVGYVADYSGYSTYDGLIAEILVYQGELSEADYQAAGAYLADKYALTTAFAVPEPQPWALLLAGGAALAGLARRRH
jgi:hypothetical protein